VLSMKHSNDERKLIVIYNVYTKWVD